LIESQGRTPLRGHADVHTLISVSHIFAPFLFDPAILLAVYGAAMFVVRVVVGRVATVGVDSSTLHYDEYRSGTCSDIAVKERCSLSD